MHGQPHTKLVSFHCLQNIIPTFTPFFFYRPRKVDDRQKKCNAQAVGIKLRSVASNHIQLVCIYHYKNGRQKIMETACHFRFRFKSLNAAILSSCYEFRLINWTYSYSTSSLMMHAKIEYVIRSIKYRFKRQKI